MRHFFVLAFLLCASIWANAGPFPDSNLILPEPLSFVEEDPPATNELPKMEQNTPQTVQQASMNPTDYGLVGAMALGILGLFGYVIKSERSDRNRLIEAINQLSLSNNTFASEVRNGFTNMERRMDALEDAVKFTSSK